MKNILLISSLFLFSACGYDRSSSDPLIESQFRAPEAVEAEALSEIGTYQEEILSEINKIRETSVTCGEYGDFPPVPPLVWNYKLHDSSLEHSRDMAESNFFAHNGSGSSFDLSGSGTPSFFYDRIINAGYTEYSFLGENIAGGFTSLESVLTAWMDSPGHCKNIMNGDFKEVGVALYIKNGSDYYVYWTQDFGSI